MKKLIVFILLICFNVKLTKSQDLVQPLRESDFIGKKMKFLQFKDEYNLGYSSFSKNISGYPYLSYSEYKNRTAIFSEKIDKTFVLKMDDNGETIYLKTGSFQLIPDYTGLFCLLDSANVKYVGKIFLDDDYKKCKILSFTFASNETKDRFQRPYNVTYVKEKDTLVKNIYITDSYYPNEKRLVFEHEFHSDNPSVIDPSICNINVSVDNFTGKKTIETGLIDCGFRDVSYNLSKKHGIITLYVCFKRNHIITIPQGSIIYFKFSDNSIVKFLTPSTDVSFYAGSNWWNSFTINLTGDKLEKFKTKPITGFKCYIDDYYFSYDEGRDFRNNLNCLIRTK